MDRGADGVWQAMHSAAERDTTLVLEPTRYCWHYPTFNSIANGHASGDILALGVDDMLCVCRELTHWRLSAQSAQELDPYSAVGTKTTGLNLTYGWGCESGEICFLCNRPISQPMHGLCVRMTRLPAVHVRRRCMGRRHLRFRSRNQPGVFLTHLFFLISTSQNSPMASKLV